MKGSQVLGSLVTLGLALISLQANAQTTVHYSDGDVMLGFWSTDGTQDYLIDLGPAAPIRDAPPGTVINFSLASSTDLVQVFGSDWYTRIDPMTGNNAVLWAVVSGRQFTDGTDPNNTLYSTNPSEAPWLRHSNSTQGTTRVLIAAMGLAYDGSLSTNNCSVCVIQSDNSGNSYRSFQPPGGVNSGGISFQTWNPSNQAGPPMLLFFNRIIPGSGPSQLLGTMTVSNNGTLTYTANQPPVAQSAFSRKTHGGAGTFDIPLPLTGNVGIEDRSGGVTNDYQMIINFMTNVTVDSASVTSGTGSVTGFSVSGSQVTVNLTGVTNVQRITVTLVNVNDGTHVGNVPVSMGVLVGDTTANGTVNAGDVAQTKSQVGQPVGAGNFRTDVNASGTITATDVAIVKAEVGTSLPPLGPSMER